MKYLPYTALQEELCSTICPLHGVVGCRMLNGEMNKKVRVRGLTKR